MDIAMQPVHNEYLDNIMKCGGIFRSGGGAGQERVLRKKTVSKTNRVFRPEYVFNKNPSNALTLSVGHNSLYPGHLGF